MLPLLFHVSSYAWGGGIKCTKLTLKFKSSSYFFKKLFYKLPVSDNHFFLSVIENVFLVYRFICMFVEQLGLVEAIPAYHRGV